MTAHDPVSGLVENRAQDVARFVDLFSHRPTAALIRNLTVRMASLDLDGVHFPITLNDSADAPNCYICCPTTAYIDYAIDETRNFKMWPGLRTGVWLLIRACAPVVRCSGLDHQVQVNNWLFSTNPMPELNNRQAVMLRETLVARYPDRAILIRSLNTIADAATLASLRAAGFRFLPARQIYLFANRSKAPPMTINMKRDRQLLGKTPYVLAPDAAFTQSDYSRCAQLYAMLYLDKYTPLNPQYTAEYISEMHQRGLLKLIGLRDANGQLVAVSGLWRNGATLTQPIVGYDTSLPLSHGLYRMIMALAQDHASAHGLFFNMSAGAPMFKRNRGAVPVIEFTAVYGQHLAWWKRAAIKAMEVVLVRIGIPMMEKFKL
jgi:Acetyltransferase (GNAT) domain